jgi:methylated-DNA-[protein]-cysteine S-methyltransferase
MTADTARSAVTEHAVLTTRLGELTVVRESGLLTGIYFPRHWPRPDRAAFGARTGRGFEEVASQVDEYLAGERSTFDLPFEARGTEFQRQVWDLVLQVPYGRTTTYGELARRLRQDVSPQDVGAAVGRNPLCLLIPCHRVIGSGGKLTGYAGGLHRKRALLEIEQASTARMRHPLASARSSGSQ